MITSVKQFGSYIVGKDHVYHDTDEYSLINGEKVDYLGGCAIPTDWIDLPLLSLKQYNHDTSIFRFALPPGYSKLNLPMASYLLVKVPLADHDGQPPAIRPYTSITNEDDVLLQPSNIKSELDSPSADMERLESSSVESGYFELLCKRYDQWGTKESIQTHFLFTRTDHSYKPPGVVSNYIHRLQPGQTLSFKCKFVSLIIIIIIMFSSLTYIH
jgi:hypothetical protein